MYTTENAPGAALEPADRAEELVEQILGSGGLERKSRTPVPYYAIPPLDDADQAGSPDRPLLAIFCFESPESVVGTFVSRIAATLAKSPVAVHLFTRSKFDVAGVAAHVVGAAAEGDLVDQAQEFARRAGNEFLRLFQNSSARITLLGSEWSAIPVMTLLQGIKNLSMVLTLHSLEGQRSDLTGEMSKKIEGIELSGLRTAKAILVNDPATADLARKWVPECGDRLLNANNTFPIHHFEAALDAGQIKARYQVGPVDPTIVFVGDLSESYGPDLLVKAMPAILKNHPQARLIVVGDGKLLWPLKVYARYLLIEHAVRIVGNVDGQALKELVQAADVVVVPSRTNTPWWPFLAAWAAHRPVVATHEAAPGVLTHDENSVLCYPSENSCVWGVERILFDAELGRKLASAGHDKLQDLFGWKRVASQIENLLGVAAASAR